MLFLMTKLFDKQKTSIFSFMVVLFISCLRKDSSYIVTECLLSCPVLSNSAALWTVARQVPRSMGLFRQEYWSGMQFPPPGHLSDSEIEPCVLCLLHCRRIIYC